MIKGMARASRVLARPDLLDSAERAVDFIRATLWTDHGLLATYKDGKARLPAYLDDHALLLDALLELLQTRWRRTDLDLAIALADILLERFQDAEQGGFYFTAHDHEPLIHRPKPLADEAVPAGNGVAAFALQRLGHLLGEPRWIDAATGTLRLAGASIARLPYAHASLLAAVDEHLEPGDQIVIRADEPDLSTWRLAVQRGFDARRLVLAIPSAETELPGALATMVPGDMPIAYRCRGTRCEPPVTALDEIAAMS
jgi:hypothetical protein